MKDTDNNSSGDTDYDLNYTKRVIADRMKAPNRFEHMFKGIEAISSANGKVVCKYTIPKEYSNAHGSFHGGLIATLVDAVSTWALCTVVKHSRHISVDLCISYFRKGVLGEEITIEGNTEKVGGRVAFLTATLRDKENRIIATGKHTKLMLDSNL